MIVLKLLRTGPFQFTGHEFTRNGVPVTEDEALKLGFVVEPQDAPWLNLMCVAFVAGAKCAQPEQPPDPKRN
jgi:hypothetical protein